MKKFEGGGGGGLESERRRREFVGGLGIASHLSENKVKNPGLPPGILQLVGGAGVSNDWCISQWVNYWLRKKIREFLMCFWLVEEDFIRAKRISVYQAREIFSKTPNKNLTAQRYR